ncbi:MAG: type I 3-dehydroquinate dehydratase [Phycisphaerae bacterium]|nr:MAG: type I 3-dehydroquinate dehydratase [Planctomycetota bacterium]KAB2949871.1 MAG: type I 3-dehydroquinate dehydratase [Phycisphaerae bacterium]MBE7457608.1 type I 3-dehydroquinate dehydratase [Planctomycetia bacterium]MCK6463876.1 type I 3-dehydroquinate dehydratase [Phycisphaerae bacterium]MCL4717410.1 type I 3-dehydroquinate dehydratase [Phycisphaerae bacterium]
MTCLIASIPVQSVETTAEAVRHAVQDGADGVELRIDGYEGEIDGLRRLMAQHPGLTWIVTCRSADEGGQFTGDTMQRVSRLIETARGTGAWVDFELADWERSANIRQKVRLAAGGVAGQDGHSGADGKTPEAPRDRLILSAHEVQRPMTDARSRIERIAAGGHAAVAKVAWTPSDIGDNFAAFDLLREAAAGAFGGLRVTAICMGEEGVLSRVLAKKLGAFATYAALDAGSATAPGQVSVAELCGLYRWRRIDANTRLFGVIGDPVAHSQSPAFFNARFEADGVNAVYLPLRVRGGDALRRFIEGLRRRPWLDVGGFSVTIPHKEAALALADEAGDALTRRIGAANTLVWRNGRVVAYNTDAAAALNSIAARLNWSPDDFRGISADVLGCGGAARAVVAALADHGCRVRIYARDGRRAAALAGDFGGEAFDWEQRLRGDGLLLINTTRVGMTPNEQDTPMPPDALSRRTLVFDLVYTPPETRLIREAAAAGAPTLGGLDMFKRQAEAQYAWFSETSSLLR